MTYSSFSMPEGPGPVLKALYERRFQREVEFVEGGDSALMLEKLKALTTNRIDLVLGISLLHYQQALNQLKWQKLEDNEALKRLELVSELKELNQVLVESEGRMLPYEWSPMTFVYRQGELKPPQSWEDLSRDEFSHSTSSQDPRFSIPGNYLSLWAWDSNIGQFSTTRMDILKQILLPLSPSWSVSYGFFRSKNAKMTFTYATSPFYHRLVEKDDSYRSVVLQDPHPFEVEWAAIPFKTDRLKEAQDFITLLLEPSSQRVLMEKNFMLPVIRGVRENSAFAELPEFPLLSWEIIRRYDDHRDAWAKEFVQKILEKKD